MLLPEDGQHPELPGRAESLVSRRAREVWPATWGCRGLDGNKTMGRGGKTRGRGKGREVKMQRGAGSEGKGRSGVEMQDPRGKAGQSRRGSGRLCRATRQRSWEGES